jgi:sugar/nucleoside kinase (ribokinase family)
MTGPVTGARFVVTPGFSAAVVERCLQLGVPVLPGVATPGEAMAALGLGLDAVKLFPAAQLGGAGGGARTGRALPRAAARAQRRGHPDVRGGVPRAAHGARRELFLAGGGGVDGGAAMITVRPAADCAFDAVALGEVMLRFDPGEGRIHTTRSFRVWEGGGEYNVVRGLRRTFGRRAGIVTALVDNPVGRLVEDLVLQGGVDPSLITWVPDDGVGRAARNGLNSVERGFGVRGALGCSDRGHTAVSLMRPGEVDWDALFGGAGVRWFHTGGVFAALSDSTAEVAREAMEAARRHGTVTSFDLNYRPSLWRDRGGRDRAQEVHGLIEGEPLQVAVELGAAHAALAMTTPGDTSMATLAEVRRLAGGSDAAVRR